MFTTKSKKEKCTIIKIDNTFHFETKTKYEIWDSKGAVMLNGDDFSVDVSKLNGGIYYLNTNSKMEKFIKK
ncbi:MAG: hypothetical protein H7331_09715 [Bacteroidia bacterium]|nr:hypothetical protein [Bacteroidia bacterium]